MTPDHFKPIPIEDWPAPAEAACDFSGSWAASHPCVAHPSENYHFGGESHPDYIESGRLQKTREPMSNSSQSMKAALKESEAAITGDRNERYGPPEKNHKRTAALWSTYLGIEITPMQVCDLNELQKISRGVHSCHRDNYIDRIGYAANAIACLEAQLPVNGT